MMATYYHGGAEIQANDNLQTLYLMNPNYIGAYSEGHNQTSPNMLLLNPSGPNALSQGTMSLAPPQHQQLIGFPLSGHQSEDPSRPTSSSSSLHHHHQDHVSTHQHQQHHHQIPTTLHGLAVSRVHYNLWSPTMDPSPTQQGPIPNTTMGVGPDMAGQMGFRRPVAAAQGLYLSLSPGQQHQHNPAAGVGGGDDMRMSVTVAGGPTTNGVILGSKYLKATQELLEEVVNVGSNGDTGESSGAQKDKAKATASSEGAAIGPRSSGGGGGKSISASKKQAAELTTAQRQELQMKKAKLLNMLDEVEQRYRQYHTQMQVVVSSFEQAAGIGSAKLYTSLALKTISKQFRCLKDAIASQIKATSKSLGEEDNGAGMKLEGGAGSRLRFVDHQLRQQRALQQLGMMQQNAWRPQRGLPERAVSVLRAWLFEHFLHPYPKDSDKHMLAKQTGLTRSQVSNWFINARVRLWKPMVEEMYTEEMKAQEQNGGTSEDTTNTTIANDSVIGTSSKNEHSIKEKSTTNKTTLTPQQQDGGCMIQTHQRGDHHTTNDMISSLSAMSTTSSQGFTLIGSSSDMESLMAKSPKKQRSNSDMNSPSSILSMDMEMKPVEHNHHQSSRDQLHKYGQDHQRHSSLMSNHNDAGTGFNPYIVNDIGRFNPDQLTPHHQYHGNAVSLTLGLPHGDNLSLSGNHLQNFMPNQGIQLGRRIDIGPGEADFSGISMGQPSHPINGFESIDIQNRKRFAAQILHDFVA